VPNPGRSRCPGCCPGRWTRDDHLGVLQGVLQQVVLLGHAEPPVEAVGVGRPPVPALPAVGVVQHRGEFQHVHEAGERAHLVAHDAPVVVGRGHAADGRAAVGLFDPRIRRRRYPGLVPGDPLVGGFAPVLGVAFAVDGVEIDPFHGVFDPLVGVDPAPFRVNIGGEGEFFRRGVAFSPRLDGPRLKITLFGDQRPDSGDLAILDIDADGAGIGAVGKNILHGGWAVSRDFACNRPPLHRATRLTVMASLAMACRVLPMITPPGSGQPRKDVDIQSRTI
jgi:hypothetical protein